MNYYQSPTALTLDSDPLVRVGESFHHVMRELASCCHETDFRVARKVGLSRMEARLLTMVNEVESLLPSEAARDMKLVRSRISLLINGLQDKGLVSSSESKHDRRQRSLRITAKGKRAAESMREAASYHLRELVQSVPANKRQSMLEHLELLYHCATVVNATQASIEDEIE
ncbi:MAG: MarR family transcriptional regulator [bacterium]|nr:MarR family transcriptional regulator [bacterium]